MAKETILIIEDDKDIIELLQYNLERQGYRILVAENGETGLKDAVKFKPDLIILDLMLPGIDGLKVCKKLKEESDTKQIPVIILTAKGEESDVIVGLEIGADDYVTKPFSPNQLIARIRAVLRRGQTGDPAEKERIEAGPIMIDVDRHEVFHRGSPLSLTLAEFNLLRVLTRKPGRVFTRDQLLEAITGGDTYLIDRNIDVHVRSIRKKLGTDSEFLLTVRGVGYKCKD